MAPPGGGRNPFSQRINACFSTINMTQPNDAQLKRIFSTLLNMKLAEFDDDVRPLAEPIVAASVEIYRAVSRELLPTPSKSHYLFNTRDLAKIVLGVMQVRPHVTNGLLSTLPAPSQKLVKHKEQTHANINPSYLCSEVAGTCQAA
jgi:hypothetical protein